MLILKNNCHAFSKKASDKMIYRWIMAHPTLYIEFIKELGTSLP